MTDEWRSRTITFIDIGTHSIRLIVVRLNAEGTYTILTRQREPVRLGEGEFETGILTDEAIERAVAVCRHFVGLSQGFGASEVRAVATSAVREAKNREKLIRCIHDTTGIEIHVISGLEEARLIYLGVSAAVELGDRNALFIDIGGGSTELAVGDGKGYRSLKSLKIGAIRLTNHFFPDGNDKPVSPEQFEAMTGSILNRILPKIRTMAAERIDLAFASSGTALTLADIADRLSDPDKKTGSQKVLTRETLHLVAARLCMLPLPERRQIPGLNPERADIIIAGAAILSALMEGFDLEEVQTSEMGVREGLLIDVLRKIAGFPHAEAIPVRIRSIMQLGRSCHIDERHALVVARLALSLYDSAYESSIHDLGSAEREILEYAALLHDIGQFISFSRHQAHSAYLIRNADLLGFTEDERELIAQVTCYHRKKMPRKKDPHFNSLGVDERKSVRTLAGILRAAEHLDRSHAGLVIDARIERRNEKKAAIVIECRNGCPLEEWALQADLPVIGRLIGVRLIIEHADRSVDE